MEQEYADHKQEKQKTSLMPVILMAIGLAGITVFGGWMVASQLGDDQNNGNTTTPPTSTTTDDVIDDENDDTASADEKREGCELLGGELNEYDECLGINESQCATLGGEWEACGSACRHDADAELCTRQCVQFCEL